MAFSPNPELRGYLKGTSACLSALLKTGRNAELVQLIEPSPHRFWHYRKWGVRALLAMGKRAEALRFAEDSRGLEAYDCTMKAAENAGCKPETLKRVRELVAGENFGEHFVTRISGHELGLK